MKNERGGKGSASLTSLLRPAGGIGGRIRRGESDDRDPCEYPTQMT